MIYLVTASSAYYPDSGTRDWKLCTPDETEARARFESEKGRRYTTELIVIRPDGTYETLEDHREPDAD